MSRPRALQLPTCATSASSPRRSSLRKAFPGGGEGKPSFANKSTLDAAVIEQMIEEKIAIGVQQAFDVHQASEENNFSECLAPN